MNDLTKKEDSKDIIVQRRLDYINSLNNIYAEGYGDWLSKQSQVKRDRINKKVNHVKYGLSGTAVISCAGPSKCPFFSACPIPENYPNTGPMSDYPIHESCVLEAEYMAQQVIDYIVHLEVDPTDVVEMSLINELALLDVFRNRAVLVLANGDKRGHGRDLLTFDENVVGFDKNGNALTSSVTKIHPAVDIMEKHEKRRIRILDKFNATREAKFKTFGGNLENHDKLQQDLQSIRSYLESLSKTQIAISADEDEVMFLQDKKPLNFLDALEEIK